MGVHKMSTKHTDRQVDLGSKFGAAENLLIDDNVADVVFAFDSFDPWEDKARGLAEVRRVLRPEGQLVVVKDGGLPGGARAAKAFISAVASTGFVVASEDHIEADGVAFTMWVCMVVD